MENFEYVCGNLDESQDYGDQWLEPEAQGGNSQEIPELLNSSARSVSRNVE